LIEVRLVENVMMKTTRCVMFACALFGAAQILPAWAYQDDAVVIDSQRGAVGGPSATIYQTPPRQPLRAPAAPAQPAQPGAPATFPDSQTTGFSPVIVVQPSLQTRGASRSTSQTPAQATTQPLTRSPQNTSSRSSGY
jgi:hypothetical protein